MTKTQRPTVPSERALTKEELLAAIAALKEDKSENAWYALATIEMLTELAKTQHAKTDFDLQYLYAITARLLDDCKAEDATV